MAKLELYGIHYSDPFERIVQRCLPESKDELPNGKLACEPFSFEFDPSAYQKLISCTETLAQDPYPQNDLARLDASVVKDIVEQVGKNGELVFHPCDGISQPLELSKVDAKVIELFGKFFPVIQDTINIVNLLYKALSLNYQMTLADVNLNLLLGGRIVDSYIPAEPKHLLLIYLENHSQDIQESKAINYLNLFKLGFTTLYAEGFRSHSTSMCKEENFTTDDVIIDQYMDAESRAYVKACKEFSGNVKIFGIENPNLTLSHCDRDFKSIYHQINCVKEEARNRSGFAAAVVKKSLDQRNIATAVVDYGAWHYADFSLSIQDSDIAYIALLPAEYSMTEWRYLLQVQQ